MPVSSTPAVDRRARRRQETFDAIEAAAWRLFLRRGFDETTVDEIAEAAGVAPRTFFRYFESKEAVLVGRWRERMDDAEAILRNRPASEPPFVAIANTVTALADQFESDRAMLVQRARLAEQSPNVGRFEREVVEPQWIAMATRVLAERLGVDPRHDPRPALLARTAMAAVGVTMDVWMATGAARPFAEVYRELLIVLAQAAEGFAGDDG